MYEKLKRLVNDDATYFSLLLVLVAVAAFALGRLSIGGSAAVDPTPATVTLTQTATEPLEYVASRSGTSYHLPWCASAQQIKAENRIRFTSKEAAEAAGYTPATNCPGL